MLPHELTPAMQCLSQSFLVNERDLHYWMHEKFL
jgi:hypothetical protein